MGTIHLVFPEVCRMWTEHMIPLRPVVLQLNPLVVICMEILPAHWQMQYESIYSRWHDSDTSSGILHIESIKNVLFSFCQYACHFSIEWICWFEPNTGTFSFESLYSGVPTLLQVFLPCGSCLLYLVNSPAVQIE